LLESPASAEKTAPLALVDGSEIQEPSLGVRANAPVLENNSVAHNFVRGFYWLDWAFLPIALTWLSGQKARAGNLNLETAYA
jgi:hypothetical protein